MAAWMIFSRSSSVSTLLSLAIMAARMKAVPHSGPDEPPVCLEMIMLIFSSQPLIVLLSSVGRSASITRKPAASELPKSPSPARASSSQK